MSKGKLITIIGLALIAGGGYFLLRHQWRPTDLQAVQVERGHFRMTIASTGMVEPEHKVAVTPPINGRVEDVVVEEGDRVKRGQVLAWMSSVDRAALLDVARTKAKAEMEELEKMYQPTPIAAPVNGTVIKRAAIRGQTITQDTQLFEISDRLVVRAEVDETDIGQLQSVGKAEVRIDAFPNTPFIADVKSIAHQSIIKNNIQVYQVMLTAAGLPPGVRSGMTANVEFIISEKDQALLLPTWVAAGREQSEQQLLVRGADGKPESRTVKFGKSDGQYIEVLSPLAAGDVVLYQPLKLDAGNRAAASIFGRKRKEEGQ